MLDVAHKLGSCSSRGQHVLLSVTALSHVVCIVEAGDMWPGRDSPGRGTRTQPAHLAKGHTSAGGHLGRPQRMMPSWQGKSGWGQDPAYVVPFLCPRQITSWDARHAAAPKSNIINDSRMIPQVVGTLAM